MTGLSATAALNDSRTIRAWCLYDWANSVYTLVVTSSIFPVYYKAKAVTAAGSDMVPFFGFTIQNSVLYSYSLSFSFLVVAAMIPLLSGMADYAGKKKWFMKVFVYIGSLSCIGLFLFEGIDTLALGLFFSIMASIGYSGSLVFYDAFLPEIVTEDRYDVTSARGYAMGYYGSVILLIVCLFMVINYQWFSVFTDEFSAMRFTFVLVGLWWLFFSWMSFRELPDNPYGRRPSGNILLKGYRELIKVFNDLKQSADLKKYLISFFFFNMGVQTVMYMATLFGTDELHLAGDKLILVMLIIQLLGALGARLFARISKRKGNKFTLSAMLFIWIGVCVSAYFIQNEFQFYLLAAMVGMIMGGIQSLARATYAKLIPENTMDHASYFSFFDVAYNLSIVLGTFSFGLIHQLTGSMRNSALALGVYFVIGLLVLSTVRSRDIAVQTT